MSAKALLGNGCFAANYPEQRWRAVSCRHGKALPFPMAKGPKPFYVGDGQDDFVSSGTHLTAVTGAFGNILGGAHEYGSIGNNLAVVHPNVYSLQLNTNMFQTAACGGIANCFGWQQFIWSQTICGAGPCVFVQYWMINHPSPCPSGWNFYPGSPTTGSGCFRNSSFTGVPAQTISDLKYISISGSVTSTADTLIASTASGSIRAVNNDSVLNLSQNWTGAEYNIVGDCCASMVYFTDPGTSIPVTISVANSPSAIPNCVSYMAGATAEANNLYLTGPCPPQASSIQFTESGGGPVPPGTSIGDPHYHSLYNANFDFMGTGDFTLLRADPDLLVQARQAPWPTNSALSGNTAVGARMGRNVIAICTTGIEVNGKTAVLDDGKILTVDDVSLLRRGKTYVISRPNGDIVQADIRPDNGYLEISVIAGEATARHLTGLLTKADNDTAGAAFQALVTASHVSPEGSILCKAGRTPYSTRPKPFALANLTAKARAFAKRVCAEAGVSRGVNMDSCTLDVGVSGNRTSADVFVHAPTLWPTFGH
jgi:hypothetical protein